MNGARAGGLTFVKTIFPVAALACAMALLGCGGSDRPVVVVYTSSDQVEATKILDAFGKKTGIEVKAVFDTEAQKTTGLAMRLVAEKGRPRADVFWNNELSRTQMLFDEGVLAPYKSPSAADIPARWKDPDDRWAAFSWRARVIVYNTEKVKAAEAPRTLEELTGARWKNQVGIARVLFGTTASHTAALADVLGEEKALDYFRRLKANGVRVYEGNSVVRDAVSNGEVLVGLTDTDDVLMGKERGMTIEMILPDQGEGAMGTLVIPNSVALVAGAPHAEEAAMLIDYLLSREVERAFSVPSRGQFPVRGEVASAPGVPENIKAMEIDWAVVSANTTEFSKRADEVLHQDR